ncbi:hypothetical protein NC651_030525 [Populus alba x Populus x berolinensis]|nr:hypothetical protein NC651_030525 [Populus alba x Populus x berolinensis]
MWSSASVLSVVPLCICDSQVSLALDCCLEVLFPLIDSDRPTSNYGTCYLDF